MTESGDSSATRLRPYSPTADPRRRRRCVPLIITLLVLLLTVFLISLILALTLFKSRDPTAQLVSANVTGISPRVTFPAVHVDLNVTLDLDLLVRNPNRAAFAHAPGRTQVFYRGAQVGEADVAPGRIGARGSERMGVRMTVEADKFAEVLGDLVKDVLGGEVGFDANTRIPGRVTFLGFIRHHAVAYSDCHVAVGIPALGVKRLECTHRTKL